MPNSHDDENAPRDRQPVYSSRPPAGGAGARHTNSVDSSMLKDQDINWTAVAVGAACIGAAGAVLFALHRYRVAGPSQYIVRTGLGIRDINIAKKAFQWPLQQVAMLDLTPQSFAFVLSAMSKEKLSFELPVNFTIGPKDEGLHDYARFLMGQDHNALNTLVKGVIEGETRILAASLSIEQIFQDRVHFKETIVKGVDDELRKFGLTVWTANVKDLQDTTGSEYFQYLRQKAVETAVNQAKIDVSEARMRGDIGEKQRVGETRTGVARIEAETVLLENERRATIAQSAAELRVKQAETEQLAKMAEITSKQLTAMKDAEMESALQQKRAITETERLRGSLMSQANVEAEAAVRRAQGEAEARMRQADGDLYKAKTMAEAALFGELKEAEGVAAKFEATANGLRKVRDALGGDSDALLQYLMVEKNVYVELAAKNADAIRGLEPKITVWSNGGGADGASTPAGKAIADIFKMLPPLASTIADQTGIKPPAWLMSMPDSAVADAAPVKPKLPAATTAAIAAKLQADKVPVKELK